MMYMLPDGVTYTNNARLLEQAWKKLAAPIVFAVQGEQLFGFDPGLSFAILGSHETLTMSREVALRLYSALTGEAYHIDIQ